MRGRTKDAAKRKTQGANTEPHRRSRKRKVIDRESGPKKNDSRTKANTARKSNRIF